MWTPMLAYHAGKGRELELERKAAARAQLDEALAGQGPPLADRRPGLLKRIKDVMAPDGRAGAGSRRAVENVERKQQPAAR